MGFLGILFSAVWDYIKCFYITERERERENCSALSALRVARVSGKKRLPLQIRARCLKPSFLSYFFAAWVLSDNRKNIFRPRSRAEDDTRVFVVTAERRCNKHRREFEPPDIFTIIRISKPGCDRFTRAYIKIYKNISKYESYAYTRLETKNKKLYVQRCCIVL